tara:strand:- start:240 stop:560 length:321 start_codon:yes stop_codon:yes gene_type:complete
MNVLIKPKVTKPWSKEMYDYNDKVADLMKKNILKSIHTNRNNWDNLNELMELCGGIKYGDGFSIDDLYLNVNKEVDNVQNYWLNEEYPYAVKNGLVDDVPYTFVGY